MMGFRFPVVFLFAILFSTTTNGFYLPSSTTRTTPLTTSFTTTSRLLSTSTDQGTSESESNLKRLQELVIEHLALDESTKITSATNFREDLGADSLDVIELVLSVEQEFDINIDDDYASKIATVKDALDYLKDTHEIDV